MTLAITGGTGFVGRRVVQLAPPPVQALARRTQPETAGVRWIAGDLADRGALGRLCEGASAVIHIAGVVNAPDRAGFEIGNVRGTANVVAAAQAAGVRRFVQVSSLSAREPGLSDYGASKAAADAEVMASGLDWVIVRPPAVYGPGDTEMLDLFRVARWGLGLAPGGAGGRISIIHVDDLARALLALAGGGPRQEILELDDGRGDAADGYSHAEFADLMGVALGRRVQTFGVPGAVLGAAAAVATLAAKAGGTQPKLSRDRARYMVHPDWVARGGNARLAELWAPKVGAAEGMAETVAGYRRKGWL
ncbi:epimerase [Polymorphobacter multimanifer]|uniref:Nucleoside-diphosphate-sugar epimerase n=1 Tax=Polymorphobacter multimanifer TaxID=1070431 RepID=A0A841LCW6_9SPHN|nr:NAD(P)-dependent oxidoreductase [Polymorphobacter multimanifer]MBB6226818.1 nucleoside-diphosphate-sugar epimerase [Polymorphobacter multimanifer]GGI67083.1 epimerase [Polymorphobacter multimanifer]